MFHVKIMGPNSLLSITISLVILSVKSGLSEAAADPVVKVQVKQGWVSGVALEWATNRTIYKFANIPYALPPVAQRRFKDPEPITSWPGTWDATMERGEHIQCLQYRQRPKTEPSVIGQEDCLYLGVYTPRLPISDQTAQGRKLLDVIVFIHGGAFMYGSYYKNIPTTLLTSHDVVFVGLNYRLGPLGFLSTGDDEVSGNMGLKDQNEALRWIKDNIAQFGGNPNSVTITGSSAGGASVHFHMLSSSSRGLFHKAISMSGNMLSPWALAENLPEKTRLVARYVGCPEDNSKQMVDCLRARPATYLVDAVRVAQPFLYNPFSPWGPTVDGFARNPILPDHPAKLILQGKVADIPWINSVTSAEGLYPGGTFLSQPDVMDAINTKWAEHAPQILDFNFTVESSAKQEVADKIRSEYMKDKPISVENYKPFIQMIGDRMFIVDAERSSRFMSKVNKAPVFFYIFNFRGRYSISNIFTLETTDYGVCHADDTMYAVQFYRKVLTNTTEEERKTFEFMNNLWVSFAAKGKPHISGWTPVRPEAFSYLQIDSGTNQIMHENVKEIGSRSFWDSLPIREYNLWPDPIENKSLATPIDIKSLATPTLEKKVPININDLSTPTIDVKALNHMKGSETANLEKEASTNSPQDMGKNSSQGV